MPLPSNLRPLMRELVRQMAEIGYERNYRRAIVEGLDTSYEARMARAAEQGFEPQTFYHSALQPLDRFNPAPQTYGKFDAGISLADDPVIARMYLDRYIERDWKGRLFHKNTMPLMARLGKRKEAYDHPTHPYFGFPVRADYKPQFAEEGFDSMTVRDYLRDLGPDDEIGNRRIGHSDARDPQAIGYFETILADPARVRSRHAMFNPKRTHMRDLLAALALALGGLHAGERSTD